MTLKDLPIGKTATVTTVGGEGALRQHFLDMGLIPKADVTMVKFAPMGDPVEVRIHGYELTLRLADAEKIEIDKIRDTITEPMRPQDARPIFHPGLGEGGKYHIKKGEHPLPDGKTRVTYYNPDAREVFICGIGGSMPGKYPMVRDEQGYWTAERRCLIS